METNLDNQTFDEWVKNPPEEYREIFQEIEKVQKDLDEGLMKLKKLLFEDDVIVDLD